MYNMYKVVFGVKPFNVIDIEEFYSTGKINLLITVQVEMFVNFKQNYKF